MIYLLNDTRTASAECEATAARLEARGFARCTHAAWSAQRRANDVADRQRLIFEDWLAQMPTPTKESRPPHGFTKHYV